MSLSSQGQPYGRYFTRDISPEGMFIEASIPSLKHNDPITINVETSLAGISMHGRVVRRMNDGLAVELSYLYRDYAYDVLHALRQNSYDSELAAPPSITKIQRRAY